MCSFLPASNAGRNNDVGDFPAMLDLIVRNATLPDGRRGIDVGVQAGRIAAIEPQLQGLR